MCEREQVRERKRERKREREREKEGERERERERETVERNVKPSVSDCVISGGTVVWSFVIESCVEASRITSSRTKCF